MGFLDSLPVKLAPIESEALEHVEDTWLDAAYEAKLARSGDDLNPIANARVVVEALIGSSANVAAAAANGSSASVSTPSLNPMFAPPDLSAVEADEAIEPEALPDNATEEELLAYAASHPLAKKAMRIFRAKIVEVKRT